MRGSRVGEGTYVDTAGAAVMLVLRSPYRFFGFTVGSGEGEGIDLRLLFSAMLCFLMSRSRDMWSEVELTERRFEVGGVIVQVLVV